VDRLLAAGAVGCNLEDTDHVAGTLTEPAAQADWLADVRAAAGVRLVINARIDVFVRSHAEPRTLLNEAVERARAYLAAGADCVYPIGLRDLDVVRDLVTAVSPAPVNVLTQPDGPAPSIFAALGVARVSMGGSVWRADQSVLATRFAELAANRDADR
jgi:2-methylisocitrate lyase-like PEP mutase family enzyme